MKEFSKDARRSTQAIAVPLQESDGGSEGRPRIWMDRTAEEEKEDEYAGEDMVYEEMATNDEMKKQGGR